MAMKTISYPYTKTVSSNTFKSKTNPTSSFVTNETTTKNQTPTSTVSSFGQTPAYIYDTHTSNQTNYQIQQQKELEERLQQEEEEQRKQYLEELSLQRYFSRMKTQKKRKAFSFNVVKELNRIASAKTTAQVSNIIGSLRSKSSQIGRSGANEQEIKKALCSIRNLIQKANKKVNNLRLEEYLEDKRKEALQAKQKELEKELKLEIERKRKKRKLSESQDIIEAIKEERQNSRIGSSNVGTAAVSNDISSELIAVEAASIAAEQSASMNSETISTSEIPTASFDVMT